MRKSFFLLLIATLSFTLVNARQISEREAQLKAEQFFSKLNQSSSHRRNAPRKAPKLILASDCEELYIFNDKANGGYVVISCDDRMPDVLAYSYDGLYDDNDIPSNMKAWMDDYAGQVAYLRLHPEAKVKKQSPPERENIEPLLTCWFSQDSPYYNKCPEVDGNRCPTGCIATAMAQIMYYYQWPKQTTEIISAYTTKSLGLSIPEQPVTTIDWDNIRGEYRNNYSNEEADAVSMLMLLCGTAVNMDYCPDSSGASDYNAAKALRKYFDYDDLLEVVGRDEYDSERWEEMIYEELNCGRPVLNVGFNLYGFGHAFVMDGYEDGYFHVNWGWGGEYSYVLMPDVGGFNYYQSAIVGIQPAYPNNTCRYAVLDNGKMTLYYDNEKNLRPGTVIPHKDDWRNYRNDITECVIDVSCANLKQRNLSQFFSGLDQLVSIDGIENLKTDDVKNLSGMFSGCFSLTSLDLSGFKTGDVTNMVNMFFGCSSLTSLDLSGLNTENVTDMGGMFRDCSSLTSLDVSSFKTDNVISMSQMFYGCSSLISLDVSNFKTDNVTNMSTMFWNCSTLKKIFVGAEWSTVNVTSGDNMFRGCFRLVGGAGTRYDWNYNDDYTYAHIDGGTANPGYFREKNVPDPSEPYALLNEDNSVLTFYYDNQMETRGGMDVFYERQWLNHSGDFTTVLFDESLASFTTLTNTSSWFKDCSKLKSIIGMDNLRTDNVRNMASMFSGCSSLTSLDVSGLKTDNVTDMSYMFSGCSNLTSLDVSGLKTDNVTDMSYMFSGCSSMTSLDVSGLKTDNVTDMSYMFSGCSSLTSLEVSGFKTDNVTRMDWMFYNCHSLASLDVSGFNTGNVTDMSSMFCGCSNLINLDMNGFMTNNVKYMWHMFSYCHSLTCLDLSSFNTANVRFMVEMFCGCSSLKKVFVGAEWSTVNVTSGDNMFSHCIELIGGAGTVYDLNHLDYTYAHIDGGLTNPGYFWDKNLPDFSPYVLLSEDNTVLTFYYDDQMEIRGGMDVYERQWLNHSTDITTVVFDESLASCTTLTNTSFWFYGCSELKSIMGMENLRTKNVRNMASMFSGCSSLTSLDVSDLKTDNVTDMSYMFSGCSSLTSLEVSGFKTDNVTNMSGMFSGCTGLKKIFVGAEWTTVNVTSGDYMFSECSKLVGGAGTRYDSNHRDYTYAHIDGGMANPGYFRDGNIPDSDPYAVLSNDNSVLTFFCDNQMESRQGMDVYERQWNSHSGDITTVVFDESFADCTTLTSTAYWFSGCSKLENILGIEKLKTDNVMDMSWMFYGCTSLTNLDVSGFNTGNVVNMSCLFSHCSSLTSLNLSGFNTENVTNMSDMFSTCSSLTSLDVSGFKTDNVTNMSNMFGSCSSLTSLDLSGFKTDKVWHMTNMFQICSSLTSLDVSSFRTDNVTSMGGMFSRCTSLISLDLSSFKTDNVTDMGGMFYYCQNLKKIYVDSGWTTVNVTWGDNMFGECSKLVGGAGTGYSWSCSDYTYAHIDEGPTNPGYFRDKNLPDFDSYALLSEDNTILTFYYDDQMESRDGLDVYWQQWNSHSGDIITVVFDESFANCTTLTNTSSWFKGCSKLENIIGIENLRTDNVTNMYCMFSGCTSLTSLDVSGFKTDNVWHMGNMFSDCSRLTSLDVSGFKTDNVTSMGDMFKGCSSLTSLDVSGFKTDNVTSMGGMFSGCSSLTSLDVSGFKTDNVTSMGDMFKGCSSLTSLDVSGFKTDNVWGMDNMFKSCSSLTNLDVSGFKTDNVGNMASMFYSCSNLTSLDVSGFKTDNVGNMASMFYSCSSLTSLDVSSFKTDNVRNMSDMFGGCSSLTSLNLSSFNTENVTDMRYMFSGCTSLTSLDLSGFKTGNVTNMGWMFRGCSSLANLDVSGFKTNNVTYMSEMFLSCSSLTSLDLSSFNTDNVTDMSWMFYGCENLTSLNVSGFKTDNVTNVKDMFGSCSSLTSLDLSSFNTEKVTNMIDMFSFCQNLKTIYVREGWNTANVEKSNNMFYVCLKLVGGEGTTYDNNHTSADYAHIDGGVTNPGYFTYKDTLNTLTYMIDGVEYKSYRLKSGVDIIPEPKPTKDGYVFLGWDEIPATMPDYDIVITGAFYPCGDVNTDKDVNVVDVVDIARFVVGTPSKSFVEILADINNDGSVNLGDAVVLINDIAGDQNFVRAIQSPEFIGNDMLTLTAKDGGFSLCLNNERKYTAFQFDLYVPENADVSKMMLNAQRNQKHQLLYNKVEEGHYRIAALSTSNNEFNGNEGELLNIAMNGVSGDEVSVRNILFFDVKGNDYLFDDINGSTTTSVRQIDNGEWIIDNSIYDLQGRKRSTLQRGVNIVGSKKVIVK